VTQEDLAWQSKVVLLAVMPAVGTDLVLQTSRFTSEQPSVAVWTVGLSVLLGLIAWKMRSATPLAAVAGAMLTACLMFSTHSQPYQPWRTGLVPVLAVLVLTSISTRLGQRRKEQLGVAENRTGRRTAQVAANLGAGVLLSLGLVQIWELNQSWLHLSGLRHSALLIAGLAALCEAAADTVSSELGQVLNSRPRMLTTLRVVAPGTDGAVSLGGSATGIAAAGLVALAGSAALDGDAMMFAGSWVGGVFGLFFDSLLGATFERGGWLNNDAVNFLSTCSAGAFALVLLALRTHLGLP
jgi:uncharacterized protein (TIGR00297 family)